MPKSGTRPAPPASDVDTDERLARTAVALIPGIKEKWGVTWADMARLLGLRSTSTLENWRRDRPPRSLSPDTLERASYLLHIYRSLHQNLNDRDAVDWLRNPNSGDPFVGAAPLDYMLRGQVRHLLDTHRYLKVFAAGAF
jgi:hypothetical protein